MGTVMMEIHAATMERPGAMDAVSIPRLLAVPMRAHAAPMENTAQKMEGVFPTGLEKCCSGCP